MMLILKKCAQRKLKRKKRIEGKTEDIAKFTFGTTMDEISNQLNQLTTLGNAKPGQNN